MERYIELNIPALPTSTNVAWRSAIKGGRRVTYTNPKYREFVDVVRNVVGERKLPDDWEFVAVEMVLSPATKANIDVDNRFKTMFDALTKIGYWRDDKIVAEVKASLTEPVKGGFTRIIIKRRKCKYKPLND